MVTELFQWRIQEGVSPPTDQNFLKFHAVFFWENLANLYDGTFPWRVGVSSYEESWIHPRVAKAIVTFLKWQVSMGNLIDTVVRGVSCVNG